MNARYKVGDTVKCYCDQCGAFAKVQKITYVNSMPHGRFSYSIEDDFCQKCGSYSVCVGKPTLDVAAFTADEMKTELWSEEDVS